SPQAARALADALASPRAWFVAATTEPWPLLPASPLQALRLELALPSPARRERLWQRALSERGVKADADAVRDVASRFTLGAGQIARAAADLAEAAEAQARAADGPDCALAGYSALAAAARAQSGAALARLAHRIRPQASLAALVTAPEVLAQLHEICQRM